MENLESIAGIALALGGGHRVGRNLDGGLNARGGQQNHGPPTAGQVTMTATGFGDQVPKTFLGRFLSVIIMLTGSLFLRLALSTTIYKL